MFKRTTLLAVALVILPLPLQAQEAIVQSLRGLHGVTQQFIMATARELDADMYAFRPTDEVRSTGQILAHIADGQFLFCSAAAGESNPRPESVEQSATTKTAIVAALEEGFAYCASVYSGTTASNAGGQVDFITGPNTRAGVLAFNSAHNYEHYGNLVTYMRLNDIVPPSSR